LNISTLNFEYFFGINADFAIIALANFNDPMGRGDKKTKKGKINIGSFGNSRRKKLIKAKLKRSASAKGTEAAVEAKPKKTAKK